MKEEELYQLHLDFAVGDARVWFRNIPRLTHRYICQRLVDSITSQFRGHELMLFQFNITRISSDTYSVIVNHLAIAMIQITKEVHDE
jgi:hypothetical protein